MKESLTFSIEIIQEEDGKGYYVVVPALPGCFSQGRTIEEAKLNVAEAISLHLKELKKSGHTAPRKITTYQTTVQIPS